VLLPRKERVDREGEECRKLDRIRKEIGKRRVPLMTKRGMVPVRFLKERTHDLI